MNNKTLRGRIYVLFFVAIMAVNLFGVTTFAATNVWGEWQTVEIADGSNKENIITSIENEFSIELWHYSGGYWGNNFVKINDSQVFDDGEKLAEAVNSYVEFEMPLPQDVINVINNGNNLMIELDTNGIPLSELFNLNTDMEFKYENNKLKFKAFPKFNFNKTFPYSDFVSGLNKYIPFVVAPYGLNRYAIWTRNGELLGAADGYFNPNNPTEIGSTGTIHPTQIANNKGYLKNGFDVLVDTEKGSKEWIKSDGISIGYNTFSNAGAVAVHFNYPVKLTFYKEENSNVGNDVAVTNITKTSYPANQGVVANVTVKNNGNEEVTTTLDFSIPNIITANETITIGAGAEQVIDFYFQTPNSGTIPMTAEANKGKGFKEKTYLNNKMMVNATIESPPPKIETLNCGETIKWTEYDSHTVYTPCINHGSHSSICTHTFVYEAKLSTTHNITPKILKSGYGFSVDVNTSVSAKMISNTGGCNNWGDNRANKQAPKLPTKADVRLNYTVSNSKGTQSYVVPLEQTTNGFITKQNPISVTNSRSIFTDVNLTGTAELPEMHNFEIYIYGGGVNGVEFCKTIEETFSINGSMYDDDGTSN